MPIEKWNAVFRYFGLKMQNEQESTVFYGCNYFECFENNYIFENENNSILFRILFQF